MELCTECLDDTQKGVPDELKKQDGSRLTAVETGSAQLTTRQRFLAKPYRTHPQVLVIYRIFIKRTNRPRPAPTTEIAP